MEQDRVMWRGEERREGNGERIFREGEREGGERERNSFLIVLEKRL